LKEAGQKTMGIDPFLLIRRKNESDGRGTAVAGGLGGYEALVCLKRGRSDRGGEG
jgi:hypothetical protein